VVFGVGGDFDLEVIAGLGADELDQLVGVAELAGKADAGGQVAAQGDDAADAGGLVALQDLADVLAGRADARQVRRRLVAFALDLEDGSKVRSWVVPPAPKVTEKNSGLSTASFWRTTRSLSAPSAVWGGKNSMEKESC
jgi:hypothetical protein